MTIQTSVATLPQPAGYRLLIEIPKKSDKIGSIIMPEDLRQREESASIIGRVVAIGPLCYSDEEKFPSGAWCSVGDYVIFRAYSGTRMKIGEVEYRLINDDTVEGTIVDPAMISRAF